jgi:hypothetical protein
LIAGKYHQKYEKSFIIFGGFYYHSSLCNVI